MSRTRARRLQPKNVLTFFCFRKLLHSKFRDIFFYYLFSDAWMRSLRLCHFKWITCIKYKIVDLAIAYKLPSITQLDRVQTYSIYAMFIFSVVVHWSTGAEREGQRIKKYFVLLKSNNNNLDETAYLNRVLLLIFSSFSHRIDWNDCSCCHSRFSVICLAIYLLCFRLFRFVFISIHKLIL